MKYLKFCILIILVCIHGLLLWSWSKPLHLVRLVPPVLSFQSNTSNLQQSTDIEPLPLKPSKLMWNRQKSDLPRGLKKKIMAIEPRKTATVIDSLFMESQYLNHGYDFFQLYRAGLALRFGLSIFNLYPTDEEKQMGEWLDSFVPNYCPNRYFPIMIYLIGLPLSFLSSWHGYLVYVLMIECGFCLVILLTKYLYPKLSWFAALAMWLGFIPYYLDLYLGQTSFLTAFFIFLALTGINRNAQLLTFLGMLGGSFIKPVPLFFTPALIKYKKWRLLIGIGVVLFCCNIVYFITHLDELPFFLKWVLGSDPRPSINASGLMRYVIPSFGVSLLLGGVVCVTIAFTLLRIKEPLLIAALWLTTYFITYNHLWEHHYIMLVPLLIILWSEYKSRWLLLCYLLIAIPSPIFLFNPNAGALQKVLLRVPKTLSTIILFVWIIQRLLEQRNKNKIVPSRKLNSVGTRIL